MVSSDITGTRGHVMFCTEGMKNVILEKGHTMQTDTIMGFLKNKSNQSAKVTVTSSYSEDLDYYVPILAGIYL